MAGEIRWPSTKTEKTISLARESLVAPHTDRRTMVSVREGHAMQGLNLGAFGGPMTRATWAQRPLRGSLWVLKYPYCHQMITQTHPTGDKRISASQNLKNSIAFGKATSQRICREQCTPK